MEQAYAYWPDYMDACREAKALRERGRCELPGRIVSAPRAKRRLMSTADVAALWGISDARVKLLCGAGRVHGAYRARKGRGRPWRIPADWHDGRWTIVVLRGSRGPTAAYALSPADGVEDLPF